MDLDTGSAEETTASFDEGRPAAPVDKWSRRARIAVLGGLAIASWVPFGALGYACSRVIG